MLSAWTERGGLLDRCIGGRCGGCHGVGGGGRPLSVNWTSADDMTDVGIHLESSFKNLEELLAECEPDKETLLLERNHGGR